MLDNIWDNRAILESTDGAQYNQIKEIKGGNGDNLENGSNNSYIPSLAEQLQHQKDIEDSRLEELHRNRPPKSLDEDEYEFYQSLDRESELREQLRREQIESDVSDFKNAVKNRVKTIEEQTQFLRKISPKHSAISANQSNNENNKQKSHSPMFLFDINANIKDSSLQNEQQQTEEMTSSLLIAPNINSGNEMNGRSNNNNTEIKLILKKKKSKKSKSKKKKKKKDKHKVKDKRKSLEKMDKNEITKTSETNNDSIEKERVLEKLRSKLLSKHIDSIETQENDNNDDSLRKDSESLRKDNAKNDSASHSMLGKRDCIDSNENDSEEPPKKKRKVLV